jgi:hypothetical protein
VAGRLPNVTEKLYIYYETKMNNQANDRNTVTTNIILDALLRMNLHS